MIKHYTLLLLIFVSSNLMMAQEIDNTRIYEIRSNVGIVHCDVRGKAWTDSFNVPPYRKLFALIKIRKDSTGKDSAVIRMLNWTDPRHPHGWQKYYYLMDKEDLDSNCIKYYSTGFRNATFTIGLITMPLKLRLGENFDFQGSFSLGTTAGVKMRISHYNPNYVDILFGASVSTINLDSFSTKGKVSGQPINNIATFSPSLGIVFEFGRAQAGIFYGWDFLGKSIQSKYEWIYDRKPWISIGFGFSILSITSKSSPSSGAVSGEDNPEK